MTTVSCRLEKILQIRLQTRYIFEKKFFVLAHQSSIFQNGLFTGGFLWERFESSSKYSLEYQATSMYGKICMSNFYFVKNCNEQFTNISVFSFF